MNAYHAVQAAQSGIYCSVDIKALGDTRFCTGGNVQLQVKDSANGITYQWLNESVNIGSGATKKIVASGSYHVVATSLNGCVAVSPSIQVTVLANTGALIANAGNTISICPDGVGVRIGGAPSATGGVPFLADKRAYGMDWYNNKFIRFGLNKPTVLDTIVSNVTSANDFTNSYFFTGGAFTPYGYYGLTRVTKRLIRIDTANGHQDTIGIVKPDATDVNGDWVGLAWNSTAKKLYGVTSFSSAGSTIYAIDLVNAHVTLVAKISNAYNLVWIRFNQKNELYALSTDDYLYKIDLTKGTASPLPNSVGVDINYAQDGDFDPITDSLYLSAYWGAQNYGNDLRTADLSTGKSILIGTVGKLGEVDALAIAGGTYTYSWSPAAGLSDSSDANPLAHPASTTTYTLKVTDLCGNTSSSQVTIIANAGKPVVNITGAKDSICVGETTKLSATQNSNYYYQWYKNGKFINGATDSIFVADRSGYYQVQVTNGLGGCDSLCKPFIVKSCEIRLGGSSTASTCSSYFYPGSGYDSGFANNEYFVKTIYPSTPGNSLQVTFNKLSYNYDYYDTLSIYDGTGINVPLIAHITKTYGTFQPVTYHSSSGPLTFRLKAGPYAGYNFGTWEAVLSCFTPKVYRSKQTGNASDVQTWEIKSGPGIFTNAVVPPNYYDDSIVIRKGHTVTIDVTDTLDQVWVQPGAALDIKANLRLNDGPGDDLKADGLLSIEGYPAYITGKGNINSTGDFNGNASSYQNIATRFDVTGNTIQTFNTHSGFSTLNIQNSKGLVLNYLDPSLLNVDTLVLNGAGGLNFTGTQLHINSLLNLQNGIIKLTGNAFVGVGNGGKITGGNNQSYISAGSLSRTVLPYTSPVLQFPIGTDGYYSPVQLQVTQSYYYNTDISAQVVNGPPASRALPPDLSDISNKRYYKLLQTGGAANSSAVITLPYGIGDGVHDTAHLRIAKDDGAGNWLNIGGVSTHLDTGRVSSTINFPATSGDFVLANAKGGTNTLPVTWLGFTAVPTPNQVQLQWVISNEINCNYYEVQHSTDAVHYTALTRLNATPGFTKEKYYRWLHSSPDAGLNYYRIKQVDKDGRFSYSKVETADIDNRSSVVVSPNPAKDVVTIVSGTIIKSILCYSNDGKLLLQASPNTKQHKLSVKPLPGGVYILHIITSKETTIRKLVRE